MKILFVCNEYPPFPFGGIGIFVKSIGNFLSNIIGVEVYVLCMRNDISVKKEFSEDKINVIQCPLKKVGVNHLNMFYQSYQQNRIIKDTINEKNIDIVEISSSDSFYLFKSTYKAKLVVRTHGSITYAILNENRSYIGWMRKVIKMRHEKIAYTYSDAIIAISAKYYKWFREQYNDKVSYIPNFLQPGFLNLAKQPISLEAPFIFHHGTLKEDKGTFDLVRAFVNSEYHKSHFLVLAGKISDKDRHILSSIKSDKVVLVGLLDSAELKRYLSGAEFSVYPSQVDAFNLCVIESMSQNCLTLVSSIIDEGIVENNVTGIRKPISSAEDILQLLNYIPQIPDDVLNEIRSNGRRYVIDSFSSTVVLEKNLLLYKSLLGNCL